MRDWNDRKYSFRLRPYRTEDNKIEGVVIVLVDVDMAKPPAVEAGIDVAPDNEPLPAAADPEAEKSLRLFARHLLAAQEDERRRISRELHDELNQRIALLELDVADLERNPPSGKKLREHLQFFRKRVTELAEDTRRIAYQLHPAILDDLGLVVALESYCQDFSRRDGIDVHFHHSGVPGSLPANTALTIYRITQEALRNISKHSSAQSAEVALNGMPDHLNLTVKDTGIGFHPDQVEPGGLGLTSIRERVRLLDGNLQIDSKPGEGTRIDVSLPLEPAGRSETA